jgi:outer membrane lipoprotein SlyB
MIFYWSVIMKPYTVSSLLIFTGMVAVLHAGSSVAERISPATVTMSPVAATTAVSGIVEAIKIRQKNSDTLDVATDKLIGNQVVSRDGRTIAMLAGPMFSQASNDQRGSQPVYDIQVRMRDGSTQNFVQDSANGLRVGDRVRPDGGRVYRS